MDLRSKLFQAGARPRETVTLSAAGEPVHIDVVALSMNARGRLLNTCVTQNADGEQEMDQAKLAPELLIECAYTPGTETPIFSAADRDALGELAAGFLDAVVTTASRISGLSNSAVKDAEGNSPATTASASASPSPAN
jgi:hypothetical protein